MNFEVIRDVDILDPALLKKNIEYIRAGKVVQALPLADGSWYLGVFEPNEWEESIAAERRPESIEPLVLLQNLDQTSNYLSYLFKMAELEKEDQVNAPKA